MSDNNTNPVIKRIAVKADCIFASPALIGGGFDENTDSDVLRAPLRPAKTGVNTGADDFVSGDLSGDPFLPGSAVAGVLKALCSESAKTLFGEQDGISPLWVFDSVFTDAEIITLDGVALDRENKVALEQKKYDYEAIATGAGFTVRLLLTVRRNDTGSGFEDLLKQVSGILKSGSVAFGAKTRRGFGRVECRSVVCREFGLTPGKKDALNEWIDFDWKSADGWKDAQIAEFRSETETLAVKLTLNGSVMIRDTRNIYEDLSEGEKAPDYKHISVRGTPVILGTSWAGAFRSGLWRLLTPKYPEKAEGYLNDVFGFVAEDDRDADVSKVVFNASELAASDPAVEGYRTVTRVKIDRFTGGAASGALFNEKPWYGGETVLEARYPKGREDIKELLLLGLEGINAGLIQIGGESSVGRGFFNVKEINGEDAMQALGKPKQHLAAALRAAAPAAGISAGLEKAGETE